MEISEHIQGILNTLPDKPGCYLMKNETGKVIYVGKAINLRNRVRSYFHKSAQQDGKTRQLVLNIVDIDWIVVGSELEALILEMNLIKKYRPRYNVLMKDDKRYPYIKVHWQEEFPRVTITRNMVKDGARYFGPFTSVWAMHQTLDLLRRVFPYRTCDRDITGKDARACLYRDIKLCTAPCVGDIDLEGYRTVIDDLCKFLEGKTGPIMQKLQAEMEQAAEDLRFEQAAVLRDRMKAIETVVERQKVVYTNQQDSDVIAMAREDGEACVQIFFIRGGKLIGREYFILEGTEDEADSEVIAEFVKQFYEKAPTVPDEVLLPHEIEEARIIQTWLNTRRSGAKVELRVPRRGKPRQLVKMATENATETLKSLRAQWEADTNRQTQALAELQEAFGLPEAPNRIECYDISNTQGTASVGSMVVFEQGVPAKSLYRRFNIKTVVGPDDFASMEEVLLRRFRRWETAQTKEKLEKKPDPSFSMLPDLLIVDGGKGQLSRAVKILDGFDLRDKVVVAGLAKQEEELFLPYKDEPIVLERHSQGLYLVQRVRDEAHRFAITAHRKRRTKLGLTSQLDAIPGIGPKRRKALMLHFGSFEAIRSASVEDLAAVPGITETLAQGIKAYLE